jgi:hypothetical protein
VLRICGPKGDEIIGGCRKLHTEELYNLHSSTNITMVKSRTKRLARQVTHIREDLKGTEY